MVPYSDIGSDPQEPWLTEKHRSVALLGTQKSNRLVEEFANTFCRWTNTRSKSIAVIGPTSK